MISNGKLNLTIYQHVSELEYLQLTVKDATGKYVTVDLPYRVLAADLSPCANAGGDTDGDGLCDDWEINGYTANGQFVDLHAMGADPMHKDIFVQADSLYIPNSTHNHMPDPVVIHQLVSAFANIPISNPGGGNGIKLHVDCGPSCILDDTKGTLWGSLSSAQSYVETSANTPLGSVSGGAYDFTVFDDSFRSVSFIPTGRQQAFHYMLFAHSLGGEGKSSGISRSGPSSDFIVSLGAAANGIGELIQQEGTFMHELGHNLGLKHGGFEDNNYKPNYLSIMNYLFQLTGLSKAGMPDNLEYSLAGAPTLIKSSLNELVGLNGGTSIEAYDTAYFCPGPTVILMAFTSANKAIDWNCNGLIESIVSAPNINAAGTPDNPYTASTPPEDVLQGYTDVPNLVFKGGAIGSNGVSYNPPMTTSQTDEMTLDQFALVKVPTEVSMDCNSIAPLVPGMTYGLTCTISNLGTQNDSYAITPSSTVSWISSAAIPAVVSVASHSSAQINAVATVPPGLAAGSTASFRLLATSQTNPLALAARTIPISVASLPAATTPTFTPAAGIFSTSQSVSLSDTTAGATIYYTIDGTIPTIKSTVYNAPISVGGSETIQAIAEASGYTQSPIVSATYTINTPVVAIPAFSPAAGSFTAAQSITISDATAGATIYYTTNGTAPTVSSTQYTGPITVSSTETIQAIATATGYVNSSVATAAYTINLPQDFTLGLSTASLSVTRGQSGTLTASVGPVNGFSQPVSFACTGLPSGASCNFSPATVTPNGTAAGSTSVSITTSATSSLLTGSRRYELAGLVAGLTLLLAGRRFRRLGRIGALLLLLVGVGSATSCGSGTPKAPSSPTSSTVSINATSGSLTHTASLTLTVQ